jgi:hypothetical protein
MTSATTQARLSGRATGYLGAVTVAAAAAAGTAILVGLGSAPREWATFLGVSVGAALAQLLLVETGRNHGFPVAPMFLVAAALLLPVELVALMGIAQQAPDLVRRRFPWYIQTFNAGNHTLNALAAWAVASVVSDHVLGSGGVAWAMAGCAAAAAFVASNHILLAGMLRLARGHSFRESGLFCLKSLAIDLGLGGLGVCLAALTLANPLLVLIALASLVTIDRVVRSIALAQHEPQTA